MPDRSLKYSEKKVMRSICGGNRLATGMVDSWTKKRETDRYSSGDLTGNRE